VAKSCITIGLRLLLKNGDFFEHRYFTRECTTRLGCGGVFIHHFVTNFLLSLTVKKIWKSVNIWWSYGQELGVLFFFDSQCTTTTTFVLFHGITPWGRRALIGLSVFEYAERVYFSHFLLAAVLSRPESNSDRRRDSFVAPSRQCELGINVSVAHEQ